MLKPKLTAIVFLALFLAAWTHGSPVDNSFACFRSAASGTCGDATAHYFDAACDGSTSDNAALAAWIAYGHALGATQAKLFIPPGSACTLNESGPSFCADLASSVHYVDNGIQNALIRGYGASVNHMWIGGYGYPNALNGMAPQTALFQTVSAGAASVTLVTSGDAAIFSVGRWVAVTGQAIQTFGFPPEQTYFEYKQITGIAGAVISFDSPLSFSYKSTWPQLDAGDANFPNQGGPATLYLMEPTWNTTCEVAGLTNLGDEQVNLVGRSIIARDIVFGANGFAPTAAKAISVIGGSAPTIEVDKNVTALTITNTVVSSNIIVQGSSIGSFVLSGVTANNLVGTAANTTLTNSTFASIKAGPTVSGHGNSLTLNGITFTTANPNYHFASISDFSFSLGTLTIAKSSMGYDASTRLWQPGMKYFMGDTDGSNTCSSSNTFTVTDIVDAGANVQIVTDISSIPVTNICNGNIRPPSTFGAYQTMTLSVTSSGPGNLLSNPEMLPP